MKWTDDQLNILKKYMTYQGGDLDDKAEMAVERLADIGYNRTKVNVINAWYYYRDKPQLQNPIEVDILTKRVVKDISKLINLNISKIYTNGVKISTRDKQDILENMKNTYEILKKYN